MFKQGLRRVPLFPCPELMAHLSSTCEAHVCHWQCYSSNTWSVKTASLRVSDNPENTQHVEEGPQEVQRTSKKQKQNKKKAPASNGINTDIHNVSDSQKLSIEQMGNRQHILHPFA